MLISWRRCLPSVTTGCNDAVTHMRQTMKGAVTGAFHRSSWTVCNRAHCVDQYFQLVRSAPFGAVFSICFRIVGRYIVL